MFGKSWAVFTKKTHRQHALCVWSCHSNFWANQKVGLKKKSSLNCQRAPNISKLHQINENPLVLFHDIFILNMHFGRHFVSFKFCMPTVYEKLQVWMSRSISADAFWLMIDSSMYFIVSISFYANISKHCFYTFLNYFIWLSISF